MEKKSLTSKLYHPDGKQQTTIATGKSSKGLKNQAVRLETIFESIPEAIIITDRHGHILQSNSAAAALLGKLDESIDLQDWPAHFGFCLDSEALTPYPAQQWPVLRALQGEKVEGEEMILQSNGNTSWLSVSSRPLYAEDGLIDGTVTQLRDITTRKRIETSRDVYVRRMETLYRLSHIIAESGNDLKRIAHAVAILTSEAIGDFSAIMLLDSSGRKAHLSSFYDGSTTARSLFRNAVAGISEFDADQGLMGSVIKSGKPLLLPSISMEELRAKVMPEFHQFVEQIGIQSALTVPMIGRSGVLGTLNLLRHRSGKPYTVGDQSFLMDIAYRTALAIENSLLVDSLRSEIAERMSAERALGVSEERFRSIFESTTLGIKILDMGGNILHTNQAFQDMIGYSAQELVGRHFYDFLHPDDVTPGLRLFHDLKVSGVPDFRFEHRIVHRDGSIVWAKTTFTGVKKGGGDDSLVFIVGILENTTEQQRIQQEMSELSSRLQGAMELERLRLAQELHDGPMQELYNAIYGIEELRMKVNPQLGAELEHTNRDIQKVLQDLRATAKELRPPTISSFGLEKAIRSHTDDFQEKHPDIRIHLSLAQDRQLLPEEIRLALFRVLQQSLVNIVRHSGANEVWVRFAFDAEQATLEIRDNGQGFKVPANWIELVRHGHYGLAGSAERINALKGTFTVQSRPGESTLIRVVVPWQEAASEKNTVTSEKS
ncbi:MAG: PAS domain S-box protein [Bacteroidota bacterium]